MKERIHSIWNYGKQKPYKWWQKYKKDEKLFYLQKITQKEYSHALTQNIEERTFNISSDIITIKRNLLSNESINAKHAILDDIRKRHGKRKKKQIFEDSEDDDTEQGLSILEKFRRNTISEQKQSKKRKRRQYKEEGSSKENDENIIFFRSPPQKKRKTQ